MAKLWLKFWTDALHDPKLHYASPESRWCWCGILLMAAETDRDGRLEVAEGMPYDDEYIAGELHVTLDAWCKARDYFLRGGVGMLHYDGDTLVVTNWSKRQARDTAAAEKQKRYRDRLKQEAGNVTGNVTGNGDVTNDQRYHGEAEEEYIHTTYGQSPLDACLAYLRGGEAVGGEARFNPGAAVGRLFTARFGSDYRPSYPRLGKMAGQLSGGYPALAKLVWGCPLVDGDPHDYLAGLVKRHPARKGSDRTQPTGGTEQAGVTDPQVLALQRMRDAQQQREHATGNGAHGTGGAAE
jgi:hypothetical protein